ncbi:exonuclease V [Russula dissimulans]|nr:exonuclease V [Russula dissimulans]
MGPCLHSCYMRSHRHPWTILGMNSTLTISRSSLLQTLCTSTPRRRASTTAATPRPPALHRWWSPPPAPPAAEDPSEPAQARVDPVARGGNRSSGDEVVGAPSSVDTRSPFEMHRLRGTLSVSDLVGPAWCEVQFDYRLRQGRSLPLSERPDSFVSAEGKVITVEKKVAKVNEEVLEHGRSVHKELELQVNPIEIPVDIQSIEEYWAAQYITLFREMPVFGILQDQPIIGIIRTRTSAPGTPRKSKKQQEPSSQSHVTSSSKAKMSRSASPLLPMINELSLIDTKTRRFNSLPSDDDAFSSRMQLMLYHRLLSALISPTFSFNTFWEKICVDPSAQLSDAFLLQSGLANERDGKIVLGYPASLDDLADIWRSTVRSLHVRGISPTLEIIYRSQKSKRGAAPELSRSGISEDIAAAHREARDIDRAIAASLLVQGHDPDLERAIAESLLTARSDGSAAPANDGDLIANVQSSSPQVSGQLSEMTRVPWYARDFVTEGALSEAVGSWARPIETEEWGTARLGPPGILAPPPQSESPNIIGRRSFAFDEAAMQAYVQDVLQWWRGDRPPRGVDVEHARRCFSCEYREDCEWREMKAKEARDKYGEHKFGQAN